MRWVALFSGQGGQRSEHAQQLRATLGSDLQDAWQHALDGADALDPAILTRNRVAQPTVVAWQVAACARLGTALPPPVLVAGYSVGEIAACSFAGGLSACDAIALAAARARMMDEAMHGPGGLAAVLGLAEFEVEALCERTGAAIAIRNGPRHFVVGGPQAAVDGFVAAAGDGGATRACALPVAVPAHTRFLDAAVPGFAEALAAVVRGPLRAPMLSGIDAVRVRTATEVTSALSRQLATALDWSACMDAIAETQPDAVLEVGPGNALARMLAEAAPDLRVRALEDFRDPAAAVAWVARQAA